jgi:hypothetical protein
MTAKLRRLRSCSDCGPPAVHGRQHRVVGAGSVHMLGLRRRRPRVLLVRRCLFRRAGAGVSSAVAAVIAHPVGRVVDNGLVVNVVNVRHVHVIYRSVVLEGSVIPISAFIAGTAIAVAVVDAAIKADMRTPVAFIPGIGIAAPAPITGSPEQARFGSHHPRTRHPVVAFIPVSPVARRPQVTIGGGHRLLVYRQRRGSDRDRHAELREQRGRYGQYKKGQQQQTDSTHFEPPCLIILRLPGPTLLPRVAWIERRRVLITRIS